MRVIATIPGSGKELLAQKPEPQIAADDEVKMKVLAVGICGTDREEAAGGRAMAPAGQQELVTGHEMLGQVVEVGTAVTTVHVGDLGVFMVRRGCGQCPACNNYRSDMCYTGQYTERGIKGADGYQAEYVVDKEQYLVKVPETLGLLGVLTEPMSVAAKAIDEAKQIQAARLKDFEDTAHWFRGKRALVAGIGPIGLMAAFILRLRGAEVIGLDVVDDNSARPQVLKMIGGRYIHGDKVTATNIDDTIGPVDFAFEAAGIARLQFELIDTLGVNAIYVATGIPAGDRPLTIPGGALMQQLVLMNQIVLGSVNASLYHYQQAVDYITEAKSRWPEAMERIITHRYLPEEFEQALHVHGQDEIKVIIDWRDQQ